MEVLELDRVGVLLVSAASVTWGFWGGFFLFYFYFSLFFVSLSLSIDQSVVPFFFLSYLSVFSQNICAVNCVHI